jgi:hypothetical protein
MALPALRALCIERAVRGGDSHPVLVDTSGGRYLVKLRGAAQGLPPLIAEIVTGELATALGLAVPARALVSLDDAVPRHDRNDELADVLARSRGTNLGVRWLSGARDLRQDDKLDEEHSARALWLDGLVMNADRTLANPNVLIWHGQPWLVDHGAALSFHYDWASITEQSPREPGPDLGNHVFAERAPELARIDAEATRVLSTAVLETAIAAVPDEFLASAYPRDAPRRMRAAYFAFLRKRLAPPRPFIRGLADGRA